jgi:hypothetical protein
MRYFVGFYSFPLQSIPMNFIDADFSGNIISEFGKKLSND